MNPSLRDVRFPAFHIPDFPINSHHDPNQWNAGSLTSRKDGFIGGTGYAEDFELLCLQFPGQYRKTLFRMGGFDLIAASQREFNSVKSQSGNKPSKLINSFRSPGFCKYGQFD